MVADGQGFRNGFTSRFIGICTLESESKSRSITFGFLQLFFWLQHLSGSSALLSVDEFYLFPCGVVWSHRYQ